MKEIQCSGCGKLYPKSAMEKKIGVHWFCSKHCVLLRYGT